MYSLRVITTSDRDLPAADYGAGLTWDRLTEVLRREVSPDAAAIFAEPIADPRLGQTHWHVTADEDPKPFSTLTSAEQASLIAKLEIQRDKISSYAKSLEAAGGESNLRLAAALNGMLEVPNLHAHLWSLEGRPVVAAWGRQGGVVERSAAAIVARQKAPPDAAVTAPDAKIVGTASADVPASGRAGAAGTAGAAANATSTEVNRRAWLAPLLWLLFALLFAASLYFLLAACAVDLPILRSIYSQCSGAAAGSGLEPLVARNNELREAIRQAESSVADHVSDCPANPQTVVPPTGNRPDATETERRRAEQHGTRGKLEITLAWNGREDLDLHIYCPADAHLFHSQKQACGGELEIDRNSSTSIIETTPVEHASWHADPPLGNYKIVVVLYGTNGEPARSVPFTVIVTDGDNKKSYSGGAATVQQPETVVEFRR